MVVRGEVEGVLVPQQVVVGVVPVALVAVGAVVIIIQDLGERWGREEEDVRPKPKDSLSYSPRSWRDGFGGGSPPWHP